MWYNRSHGALRLTQHTWSTLLEGWGRGGGGWQPTSPPPPSFNNHHQYLSIQAVSSLVGLQELGGGGRGVCCIHSLTMIKTHSEEPFKSPVPIMESLIGAYSSWKVFSGGEEKKKFWGSNNHFVCCLVYVKFMQRSIPPPFSNSFCCLFF